MMIGNYDDKIKFIGKRLQAYFSDEPCIGFEKIDINYTEGAPDPDQLVLKVADVKELILEIINVLETADSRYAETWCDNDTYDTLIWELEELAKNLRINIGEEK